jgi:hypothetical protein
MANADREELVQSAGVALVAVLDGHSEAISNAQARSILMAASGASLRHASNMTSRCVAADVCAAASGKLGSSEEDTKVLQSAAASMLESTAVDLNLKGGPFPQQLAELRLLVLAALAHIPWPAGLEPLAEVRAIRAAFPASRRIVEAGCHMVKQLSSDPRVPAVELEQESEALLALRERLDRLDQDLSVLQAHRWRMLSISKTSDQAPLTLARIGLMLQDHPRSRWLHDKILEVLEQGDESWPSDALADLRQVVTMKIAAGDFDPPGHEAPLRRTVHEHRLKVLRSG